MSKCLETCYDLSNNLIEIGIDEVGRGPLFGRVYSAAVILPKSPEFSDFKYELLKDSKKFTSRKKIKEVAEYIKLNVKYYAVSYVDEKIIDQINIKNASYNAMHNAIHELLNKLHENKEKQEKQENIDNANILLMVDGNSFKPVTYYNDCIDEFKQIKHVTIVGGDNKYCNIAAASILAKVDHDQYIEDMCTQYPKLHEYYDLNNNKGYGTKRHIEGIKKYGISPWHRTTYSPCKLLPPNNMDFYK
jgi:ribonuclease HII